MRDSTPLMGEPKVSSVRIDKKANRHLTMKHATTITYPRVVLDVTAPCW